MEVVLPLLKDYERPVIEAGTHSLMALIDTGAMIPMLNLSGKEVETAFSGEKVMEKVFCFDIYGGHRGDIYRLPEFDIGGIVFAPFDIFVPEHRVLNFWMLISGSMFYNYRYSIDMHKRNFTIDMPEDRRQIDFRIKMLSDRLYPQVDGEVIDNTCPIITEGRLWGM